MNTSENLNELFAALAKAQGEMDYASKNSTNPFFKSKYADFKEVIRASRPSLSKHGLSVVQLVFDTEYGEVLSSVLGHSSGQWMESRMKINPPKSDIQSKGSYMTYLKRYSYSALVGVATEDDDGEAAMESHRSSKTKAHEDVIGLDKNPPSMETDIDVDVPAIMKSTVLITPDQLEQLEYELKDHSEIARDMMQKMNLRTLKEMPKAKFLPAIERIREIKLLKK